MLEWERVCVSGRESVCELEREYVFVRWRERESLYEWERESV